jgi:hypothetical protein
MERDKSQFCLNVVQQHVIGSSATWPISIMRLSCLYHIPVGLIQKVIVTEKRRHIETGMEKIFH